MKQNKSKIVQRRQRILAVAAMILGILAGITGLFGFADRPVANDPVAVPETIAATEERLPTEVVPAPIQAAIPTNPADSEEDGAPTEDPEATIIQKEYTKAPNSGMQQTVEDGGEDSVPTEAPTIQENHEEAPDPVMHHAAIPPGTVNGRGDSAYPEKTQNSFSKGMKIACLVCLISFAVDLWLLLSLRKNVREHEQRKSKKMGHYRPTKVAPLPVTQRKTEQPLYPIPGISLGKVHDMGKREYQQDSFGQSPVLNGTGILAVLADGMGGLSNGERVSQRIIIEALNCAVNLQADQIPGALPEMVEKINRAVNQMLGPDGLYASGSTLVSALIANNALWWISVGDSRIYLYRDFRLNQVSRDHDLFQDWMPDILDGKRSIDEAMKSSDGRKLTSFIGMGELRYVDCNHCAIPLLSGDRVLLMSDGVYGTVSDAEMADILQNCANVQDAASQIARKISAAALPYQDNYTLVILGYDSPGVSVNNGT